MPSRDFPELPGSVHVRCHLSPKCGLQSVLLWVSLRPELTHEPVTASRMWADTRPPSQRQRAFLLRPQRSARARARSDRSLCAPTRGLRAGAHVGAGASQEGGTALGEPAVSVPARSPPARSLSWTAGLWSPEASGCKHAPEGYGLNGAPPERPS